MMRRLLVLVLLSTLVTPGLALAQGGGGGNPFGPLPPPQQTPEEPEPQRLETDDGDDDGLGGTAFWLIIGTTFAIFAVVAFLIVRDMRRTVGARGRRKQRRLRGTGRPAADAANALSGDGRHHPGSHKARAKAQQRAKTKAARKQRRRSRSR